MELTNAQRAAVLVHALPYIQRYAGKIVVIKYGGHAMLDDELKRAVMRDVALLSQVGVKVVLVHGGGPEISARSTRAWFPIWARSAGAPWACAAWMGT